MFVFEDVTEKFINKRKKKLIDIESIEELYIIDNNKVIKKYTVKNAKFRKKDSYYDENKTIERICNSFNWKLYRLKEIDYPLGIKTPDIKVIFKGYYEYWDIKNIHKSKTYKSKKRKIQHAFDSGKNQVTRFIIDINSNDCDLKNIDMLNQTI